MKYFVSPPEETDWNIKPDEMTQYLRNKWANVRIKKILNPEDNNSLEWEVPLELDVLYGSIDREGQSIHLEGDIQDCAQFAVWFRSIVPESQVLVFFDENYTSDISLGRDVTEQQIVGLFTSK